MTKGERLIWELFEMVRELMPPTAQNNERWNLWAARFRELEQPSGLTPAMEVKSVEDDSADEDDFVEPPADPHEHGVPTRRRKKR